MASSNDPPYIDALLHYLSNPHRQTEVRVSIAQIMERGSHHMMVGTILRALDDYQAASGTHDRGSGANTDRTHPGDTTTT